MLVPIRGSSLLLDLADAAEKIDPDACKAQRDAHWSRSYLIGGPLCLYQSYLGAALMFSIPSNGVSCLCFVPPAIVFLLLLPLPVLAIQKRINALKAKLAAPRWTHKAYRWKSSHRFAKIGVIAMVTTFALSQLDTKIDRWRGESLTANLAIAGTSGLYTLTPSEAGWVRVGADHFHADSDLSLYGPSEETHVLIWVRCDGVSVEDRVRFRRRKKRAAYREMRIDEERRLLPESFLPISFARYEGVRNGRTNASLVATVAQGDVMVEVIGTSTGGEEERAAMERMVMSLKLKEDVTSCDGN